MKNQNLMFKEIMSHELYGTVQTVVNGLIAALTIWSFL